jgi:predicted nucleotidyltransferase
LCTGLIFRAAFCGGFAFTTKNQSETKELEVNGGIVNIESFMLELEKQDTYEKQYDFCRKFVLHGTPFVFGGNDNDFYEFRKKIANKYNIPFHEIYITGSGKLGFSPFKLKEFDYDSDIDVAIISPKLFENIMRDISKYQMSFRKARSVVRESELEMYHQFLEYVALGWIRPDKLPISFQMKTFKNDWFKFFQELSYGKSEVGNYKVNAGVFQSYKHLEDYIVSGLVDVRNGRLIRKNNGKSSKTFCN